MSKRADMRQDMMRAALSSDAATPPYDIDYYAICHDITLSCFRYHYRHAYATIYAEHIRCCCLLRDLRYVCR